jgi:hypothetical protein
LILNLCFGSVRPYSVSSGSQPYITIENIIKVSKDFDFCFVINDNHSKDDIEFTYLPPHIVKGGVDVGRLHYLDRRLQSKYVQFLTKNTLSAIHDEHNKKTILSRDYSLIAITGFSASTDITATCLNLIDEKKKIAIIPSCVDDSIKDYKTKAINYLTYLGIPSYENPVE